MKKLLLLALVTIFTFSLASAQTNKAVFGPLVGDGAGQIIAVNGQSIDLEVWVRTDPGNPAVIVGTAHGLMTEDQYIAERNDGTAEPEWAMPNWEQFFIDPPNPPSPPGHPLGYYTDADGGDFPYDPGFKGEVQGALYTVFNPPVGDPLDTQGEWVKYMTWHVVMNVDIEVEQEVCPFSAAWYPHSGEGTKWAFEGGGGVTPEQDYSCVWISANTDPVLTVCPQGGCADGGMELCFDIAGEDLDELDDLQITLISGPGEYTADVSGPGGAASGTWCWDDPQAGEYVVVLELNDNAGAAVLCEFPLSVGDITFEIDCVASFPGGVVIVPVRLHTCAFETGGIEFLGRWDPTALELLDVQPQSRIDFGEEYFYWNDTDPCEECPPGGAVRVTWISDINNGVPHAPAPPGSASVFNLIFQVDPALPWGMEIPVEFHNLHYSDNTISDQSGYIWWTPEQIDGCVVVEDAESFKGDPNMNGTPYEIGDAVIVALRLIHCSSGIDCPIWSEGPGGPGDDALQEAAADLNNNGFADIADLLRFINIINDIIPPPKVEPSSTVAQVSMPDVIGDNMEVTLKAGVDVGGVLLSIEHPGVELDTPVANNGMELLYHDADGVMNVVVFSKTAEVLAAGNSSLFTIPVLSNDGGSMSFAEVSSSDSYGRLMETVASLEAPLPTTFAVEQNYPNPFNAKTQIGIALPEASDVVVDIYSITGQMVESVSGYFEAGNHSITWDASDVSSGVYFYKITAGDFSQTMKMTLLK